VSRPDLASARTDRGASFSWSMQARGEATDKAREAFRHVEDAVWDTPVRRLALRHQRPWSPTAAHGGRSHPSGTCLPRACVEAAQAAYEPDGRGRSAVWDALRTGCRAHPPRAGRYSAGWTERSAIGGAPVGDVADAVGFHGTRKPSSRGSRVLQHLAGSPGGWHRSGRRVRRSRR
jgi:hypothetical protein